MTNIASVLKSEIARLSRREIRKQVQPLRKASAAYRREIAALKRQIADLRKHANAIARNSARPAATGGGEAEAASATRFVAKGLRSMRSRLGLSAAQLALLIGVSEQSVYNWETKKARPRKEQQAALSGLRSLGKRDVRARLDALASEQSKKKPARKTRKTRKKA